ncbi:S-layer homology domain-containing protein [Lysinibacillus fusiformis]|uniref:S-layer homology domain-containing protein n=1 Tax=Lysinibacillus fusiformis TaxID=28031 RepID=UPI001F4E965E|nr:S-layer homology domain-containing protein [Lysinibacillus fusiformis]MCK1989897.1 S-layer homology domain-containing protein [Lysinibacillus fusiformis]
MLIVISQESRTIYLVYPDGSFKPNASVTRAQLATMLARFLTNGDIPTINNSSFEETIIHLSKDAIEVVQQVGLFNGTTEKTFNPNGTITRAQAVKVLNQLFERPALADITTSTFKDVPNPHWAIGEIEAAATEKWSNNEKKLHKFG